MTELSSYSEKSHPMTFAYEQHSKILGDGEALQSVCDYAFDRFGIRCLHDERDYDRLIHQFQWEQVRDMLQRALSMHDLETAIQRDEQQFMQSLANSCDENAPQIGGGDPGLPHGWLTLLEAAYERLGDTEGLRRTYEYYIITGTAVEIPNKYDPVPYFFNHYVEKLHELDDELGDGRWQESIQRIEHLYDTYRSDPMFHSRNRPYEALLIQEQRGAAAMRYCARRCKDWYDEALISDLFPVLTEYDFDKASNLLLQPLHDADSKLLRDNTPKGAQRIANLLRRLGVSSHSTRIREEAERLIRMYRHRDHLKAFLKDLIKELPQIDDSAAAS